MWAQGANQVPMPRVSHSYVRNDLLGEKSGFIINGNIEFPCRCAELYRQTQQRSAEMKAQADAMAKVAAAMPEGGNLTLNLGNVMKENKPALTYK